MSGIRVQLTPWPTIRSALIITAVAGAVGGAIWMIGMQVLGTSLMLGALAVVVVGFVLLGSVIAAGLPRPIPFADRSLLAARLASMGKTLWTAALISVGGYFGAIIATDLSSPSLNSEGRVGGYLVTAVVLIVTLAAYGVVFPMAVGMGIELLRAGAVKRRAALGTIASERLLTGAWLDHLSRPQYAWASLVAMAMAVPLLVAALFWTIVAFGYWTWRM